MVVIKSKQSIVPNNKMKIVKQKTKKKDWNPDDEPAKGKRPADQAHAGDAAIEGALHKKKKKTNSKEMMTTSNKLSGDKRVMPSNSKLKKKSASKKKAIKTTGKFDGKSNQLGKGGRAAQLQAQGVPGGVIGNLARAAHAAPGQANYHKKKSDTKMSDGQKAYLKRVGGKK